MNFVDKVFETIKESRQKYLTIDQINKIMGIRSGFDKQAVASAINELVKRDMIVKSARGKFTISENTSIMRAILFGTTKGYAFARVEGEQDDYFIPERMLNGAVHGDKVLIKPIRSKKTKNNFKTKSAQSNEAEVIKIVERGMTKIVGIYQETNGISVVVPDDKRVMDSIFIPFDKRLTAKHNTKVVVKLLEYPSRTRMAQGEVVEVLGPL